MSYFSGAKLRRIRKARRLSMSDVFEMTGISKAQISKIENGKVDPRISTVTRLLSCYGASLNDLESSPSAVVSLKEVRKRAGNAAEVLRRSGLGTSDPRDRLARKSELGIDTEAEVEALATRSQK